MSKIEQKTPLFTELTVEESADYSGGINYSKINRGVQKIAGGIKDIFQGLFC